MNLATNLGKELASIGQIYIFSNKSFGSLLTDPLLSITANSTCAVTNISLFLEKDIENYRSKKFRKDEFFYDYGKKSIKDKDLKELTVILKADMQGSIEAISAALNELGSEEVSVRIIHGAVGAVSESDVTLWSE